MVHAHPKENPVSRLRRHAVQAVLAAAACFASAPALALAAPPLARFPTVGADRIAFVARGDLWTISKDGGPAKRLTNDLGQVLMPHFSPDGASIAFSWRRAGGTDVYVISAKGGAPRR